MKTLISFILLRKFCVVHAVSMKSTKKHIPGNEVESSQKEWHYIHNSFLLWSLKEWILIGSLLSEGALVGSVLLEQKFKG